jgi:hypothetical protein
MYNAGIVVVNSEVVGLAPGANPTIMNNNDSAVKACVKDMHLLVCSLFKNSVVIYMYVHTASLLWWYLEPIVGV